MKFLLLFLTLLCTCLLEGMSNYSVSLEQSDPLCIQITASGFDAKVLLYDYDPLNEEISFFIVQDSGASILSKSGRLSAVVGSGVPPSATGNGEFLLVMLPGKVLILETIESQVLKINRKSRSDFDEVFGILSSMKALL